MYFSVFVVRNTKPFLQLFTGVNSLAYFLTIHSFKLRARISYDPFLSLIVGVGFLFSGKNSLSHIQLL